MALEHTPGGALNSCLGGDEIRRRAGRPLEWTHLALCVRSAADSCADAEIRASALDGQTSNFLKPYQLFRFAPRHRDTRPTPLAAPATLSRPSSDSCTTPLSPGPSPRPAASPGSHG